MKRRALAEVDLLYAFSAVSAKTKHSGVYTVKLNHLVERSTTILYMKSIEIVSPKFS